MKKEIIKSFDLASYKNGAKVKTRDGHEVRIICTDAKDEIYPIIALAKLFNNDEVVVHYTSEGKTQRVAISDIDLVIVDEVGEPEFWSDNKNNTLSGFCINNVAAEGIFTEVEAAPNIESNYDVFASKKQAKSARAMARISQIMANDIENFGGVVTDEEWHCNASFKHTIERYNNEIKIDSYYHTYNFLAFHTREQRDLFLKENEDLVKDYLMID